MMYLRFVITAHTLVKTFFILFIPNWGADRYISWGDILIYTTSLLSPIQQCYGSHNMRPTGFTFLLPYIAHCFQAVEVPSITTWYIAERKQIYFITSLKPQIHAAVDSKQFYRCVATALKCTVCSTFVVSLKTLRVPHKSQFNAHL